MAFYKPRVFQQNLDAIKLVLQYYGLSTPQGNTTQLLEILDNYRGFGGLKEVLLGQDASKWPKSSLPLYPMREELEKLCLKLDQVSESPNGSHYESVRNSILSAFYTPPAITSTIARQLIDNFPTKLIIEPSAGHGAFIDSVLEHSPITTQIFAVEKDLITAALLKTKYQVKGLHRPGANGLTAVNIFRGGLEHHANTTNLSKKGFDLALSNIPFGDVRVSDLQYLKDKRPVVKNSTARIHNYFFIKNLDLVRDGGLVAFITTASFLNSPGNEAVRKYLLSKSDIVSVVRLPNSLFSAHAGTEVSSDLIVLQKNEKKTGLGQRDLLLAGTSEKEGYGHVNNFFNFYQGNDHFIAQKIRLDTDLYGTPAAILDFEGGPEQIAELLSAKLERDITAHQLRKRDIAPDIFSHLTGSSPTLPLLPTTPKVGGQYDLFSQLQELSPQHQSYSGKIYPWYRAGTLVVQDGVLGHLGQASDDAQPFNFEVLTSKMMPSKARAYIALRDAFRQLYDEEKSTQVEQPSLRIAAKRLYDAFEAPFGQLNHLKNRELVHFDALGSESMAIEKRTVNEKGEFVYAPADLFFRPVAIDTQELLQLSPLNALFLSVNRSNKVDLDLICKHSGLATREEAVTALKGHIYYDFEKSEYQYKDEFLSGDVNRRLAFYRQNFSADALANPQFPEGQSYQALQAVLPKPIAFAELEFNLGERWLDIRYYEAFASKLFQEDVQILYVKSSDTFKVRCKSASNSLIQQVYAVSTESEHFNGLQLLEYGMVSNSPQLTRVVGTTVDGQPIRKADHEGMRQVAQKIEEIASKFEDYIRELPDLDKKLIAEAYNQKFNSFSTHRINGEHMHFSGLQHFVPNSHQKDAAWKLVLDGGGICDHPVGAGKSLVMALESQKLKEIGLAKKPMLACLKANAADVARDYLLAFPNAKVLFPGDSDFTRSKRASFLNMIKNNDWDAVIVTHEQFSMIPQDPEVIKRLLERELFQVEEDIREVSAQGGEISSAMLKGLVTRKQNLSAQLSDLVYSVRKEENLPHFIELGIDHLSVDESHEFKNLAFTTRHSRVAGLGNTQGSQRAFNMLVACRSLQELHGADRGISFYSGTTISNSLTELYNLFKYLAPATLEKQQIYNFDSWAAVFTKKSTEYEMSVTNELIMKERFRKFIKVPELCAMYQKITHFISQGQLQLDRPDHVVKLVKIPQTEAQIEFSKRLVEFASTGEGSLIFRADLSDSEKNAKMLIATNTARKMAVDMRLIDPSFQDDPRNKLSIASANMAKFYQLSEHYKGTQLVFCDLGTPKPGANFDIYNELKRKLVTDHGIPEKEIAFIHEAKTNRARAKLFDAVNRGDIRFLVGSTKKMGTGVNVQKLVVAMHDLNIPWTPKDLEQRHGRGHRQGNQIAKHFDNKVLSFVYATDRSLDAYSFNLLKNKQLFISQVKSNSFSARSVDEGSLDESSGMPFNEYVALLSGNTDLLDKLKLDKKIAGLEAERKSFSLGQHQLKSQLEKMEQQVLKTEKVFRQLADDSKVYLKALQYDPKTNSKLNPISLIGKTLATPEEAGNAVINLWKQACQKPIAKDQLIGHLYGFELYIQAPQAFGVRCEMYAKRGFVKYSYSNGTPNENPALAARYFLNAIDRCKGLYHDYTKKLEDEHRNINLLRNQLGRTWDKEGMLSKLKAEVKLVENRIIHQIQKGNSEAGSILKAQKLENEKSPQMVNISFDKSKGPNIKF